MPEPGTYFTVPQSAIDSRLPEMGGAASKVFLYLCRHADRVSGECFRSQTTIAQGCGFGIRTTRNCLNELADLGVIQSQNRGQQSNLYRVTYPARSCRLDDDLTGKELPDNDLTGKSLPFNRQDPAAYQASLSKKKESSCSSKGGKPGGGMRRKASDYSEAFGRWYATYPKKAAPEKAFSAFEKAIDRIVGQKSLIKHPDITTDTQAVEFLIDRAKAYAASEADTERRFLKHPSTWLNGGEYDSEYESDIPEPSGVATKEQLEADGWTVNEEDDE